MGTGITSANLKREQSIVGRDNGNKQHRTASQRAFRTMYLIKFIISVLLSCPSLENIIPWLLFYLGYKIFEAGTASYDDVIKPTPNTGRASTDYK